MRQDSKWSEAKAGNIYSVWVKLPRGERSYRSSWTLQWLLELYQPHLFVHRRPLYAPCIFEIKKTMGAHGVDKHSAETVGEWWLGVDTWSSESSWGLVYGLGFVHRCRDNKIWYMMDIYASSASARSRFRNPLETSGMCILFKSRSIRQTRSHLHPPHKRVWASTIVQ